jgi:hypothetical protein
MSATVPSTDIGVADIKGSYDRSGITSAAGNTNLKDGNSTSEFRFSYLRGVTFTDGSSIGASGAISINAFKGKTFGTSGGGRGGRSDRRLKHNLQFIETPPSGIPIYEFNFKPEYSHLLNDTNLYSVDVSARYRGVLAQDLLDLGYQDSVFIQDDYYCVKYDEIDVDFVEV